VVLGLDMRFLAGKWGKKILVEITAMESIGYGEVDGSGRKADFSTTLFTKSVNSFGRNDVLRAEVF
jgi:hypothetical protein